MHYGAHWGDILVLVGMVIIIALVILGMRAILRMVRRHR